MKMKEMKEIATPIIESGFESGADHDDIKGALVAAKIPFGKINSLFKTIAIELELMRDPADIKSEIDAQVTESEWDAIDTWDQITSVVEEIMDEVEGSTEAQVLSVIRAYFKDQGLTLPKKTAKKAGARSTGGKIQAAVFGLFASTQKPTKQELYDAVEPCISGKIETNTIFNVKHYFILCYALCNNMTMEDAHAETKDMVFGAADSAE